MPVGTGSQLIWIGSNPVHQQSTHSTWSTVRSQAGELSLSYTGSSSRSQPPMNQIPITQDPSQDGPLILPHSHHRLVDLLIGLLRCDEESYEFSTTTRLRPISRLVVRFVDHDPNGNSRLMCRTDASALIA